MNQQFLQGSLSIAEAEDLLRKLISLYRPPETKSLIVSAKNIEILKRFWEDAHSWREYVDKASERSVLNDYRRAVESLGTESLLTADSNAIRRAYKNFDANKRRRMIQRLQPILKWLKRDVRIPLGDERRSPITHITEKELKVVCDAVDDENVKLAIQAAFYSGCRVGELLMLGLEDWQGGPALHIHEQLTQDRKLRAPKRGKTRDGFVPPEGCEIVQKWCALPAELKWAAIRGRAGNNNRPRSLRAVTQHLFPGNPTKHITFHALRHSYVLHLLSQGHQSENVCASIGDDYKTFKKYYSGYILTQGLIEAMEKLYKTKKS